MAGVLGDAVDRTLRRWAREGFEWGTSDCALSVFRYMAEGWGEPRPVARWAGRYMTEAGADAITRTRGGAVRAFQDEMASIGARRTKAPVRGSVGIVRDGAGRAVAALCTGEGWWAAKTETGFAVFRTAPLLAYDNPRGAR